MTEGFFIFLVLSFCSAQGYALYSEQVKEQARNQRAVAVEKAMLVSIAEKKAALVAATAVARAAKTELAKPKPKPKPTATPNKSKPSPTVTPTMTPTTTPKGKRQ